MPKTLITIVPFADKNRLQHTIESKMVDAVDCI